MKPALCQPTPDGCRRCQRAAAEAPQGETALLLGAHNAHAQEALARSLGAAQVPFRQWGAVFALPAERPALSPRLLGVLDARAGPTRDSLTASFFQGSLECPGGALSAFVGAQPLAALLARADQEWVREALDEDWLVSFYHPIIAAGTGEIYGYEALLRARRPHTGELIGAGALIGACDALDLGHVLDQKARQAAIRGAVRAVPGRRSSSTSCLTRSTTPKSACGRRWRPPPSAA